jgi:hypothetical protein
VDAAMLAGDFDRAGALAEEIAELLRQPASPPL